MAEEAEMQKKLHDGQTVKPGRDIVDHNPGSFRQPFELPHRVWFHDIERSKKYKARQKRFPSQRCANQRNQLPRSLVDHDELRIFDARGAGNACRGRNSDGNRQYREKDIDRDNPSGGKKVRNRDPDEQRRQ